MQIALRGVISLAVLMAGGCVSLAKSFPEKHYFALDAVRPEEPVKPGSGTILKIHRFHVSPRFEGKEMVYRTSDTRYETDFYNEWFIAPAAMVTQQAQNWISNAGVFQYVVDASSYLDASHILEGAVTALYGDYRRNGAPKAVLDLQIILINDRPTRADIVFRRDYHQTVDMADASPDALTKGWNQGLREILAQLEKDLRQLNLNTHRDKPPSE
jgi:cholesterol transport system auxiliary component